MNTYKKTFNVPVVDKMFEIEFEHNQTWNKMIVKVDGKTQQTRSSTFWSQKNDYLFEIGSKAALPCHFLKEPKKMVSIITTRQTNGGFKYEVKVDGKSLKEYKKDFAGRYCVWELKMESSKTVRLYLEKSQNILWFGGKLIGRLQICPDDRFSIWFSIANRAGEITRGYTNGKLEYTCTYGYGEKEKVCRQVDFDSDDV